MKELLEDYQRRYKIVNDMIRIEKDPETLGRLNTKSICYREFINELERKITAKKADDAVSDIEFFVNSLTKDDNLYQHQKGYIPYLGKIDLKGLTPMAIINKIYELGRIQGIESGKWEKTEEIKKVLNIKDED